MLRNFYKSILFFILNLIPKFNYFDNIRGLIFILLGVKSKKNFKVGSNAFIFSPEKLTVGKNCYIGVMSYLGNGYIEIGDDVLIGNNVSILPSNHQKDNQKPYRFGTPEFKKIVIEKGSWLCAQSIITAGVKISENSKIAAGSIMLKSNKDKKFIKGRYK
jgi:acetyltransferase-like isoleucine patch superfamily enzyme